ncbi:hypothetical protein F5880DRAFT_1484214, partial [Lentinula raphanica]
LTHGCEVIIDTNKSSLSLLEDAQHLILRRLLGLSRNSILAPLFTETGIMPIRPRRVILALRYLAYILDLAHDHYAYLALLEKMRIFFLMGERSWLSDLDWAIQNLPGSSSSLPCLDALSTQSITALSKAVTDSTMSSLQLFIDQSPRLALLQNRQEPHKDGTKSRPVCSLRHYLTLVRSPDHRVTLTKLLCGDLTPVTFHASPASAPPLPVCDHQAKGCRACHLPLQPESPQHVLLQCQFIPELVDLRNGFLTRMSLHFPLPHSLRFDHASATHYLKLFVFNWDSVVETAKFIHEGISLWKSYLKDDRATTTDDEDEEV